MSIHGPKRLQKNIKRTNIVVQKVPSYEVENQSLAMLHLIDTDDTTELLWFHNTLRPRRNLIASSKLFLQGIKALQPASQFNTFDLRKLKLRRLAKQRKDTLKALERRKEIAPTAVYRAAVNPHKVPRTGGRATEDEAGFMLRGRTQGKQKADEVGDKGSPQYFIKWRKQKFQKIGKGL
ncbi:unnamed protein product [Phytomonas sp. EM1]|nr:unnamed protein product [Phytomonas sp. EM1]|eukprot:CCW64558.1 unnamed protein product [Phytomonas sp. isolate EM1]